MTDGPAPHDAHAPDASASRDAPSAPVENPVEPVVVTRELRVRRCKRLVLDGIDLSLGAGLTLLVGPSGAGKSTVFQLLLRFYDPALGSIKLDGVEISNLTPQDLRKQFAVVSQEPALFSGSLEANVSYGRPDAARKEVVLKAVYTGRFAEADEVAKAIVWLGTESPEYINGTCVDINDGSFPR